MCCGVVVCLCALRGCESQRHPPLLGRVCFVSTLLSRMRVAAHALMWQSCRFACAGDIGVCGGAFSMCCGVVVCL